MAKPRALVLTGFGINCDDETLWAMLSAGMLDSAGANADRVHLNDLIERKSLLDNYQILFFPGGFSYGDDIRSGKVLALKFKSHLGDKLTSYIKRDTLTAGFCNGFQIMVQLGIVPAINGNYKEQTVTLANNSSNQYEDRWVHLEKPENHGDKCVFTRGIGSIYLPVAHGEGKFFAAKEMIKKTEDDNLVVFRYSIPDGENPSPANGRYPENPNGSVNDIAGICDPTGRIFGMMPHPERCLNFTNHPQWTMMKEAFKRMGAKIPEEGEGMKIFRNAVEYFK